ncbi:MAG: ABC transporter substrate-binding protein [Chloroflexi bacterium]|nr:ABC transporter substrate-binding protein [Chloroflexota bacterium]
MPRSPLVLLPLALCLMLGCGTPPTAVSPTAATVATPIAAQPTTAVSAPTATAAPAPTVSPSPTPTPLVSVRLVAPPMALGSWQVDVADRKGFFREQGLFLERAEAEEDKAIVALVQRARDVALLSTPTIAGAVRDGEGVVMVAGAVNRAAYSLIGARDAEDLGGLIGKSVGIRDSKDVTTAILRRTTKAGGLGEAAYQLLAFPDPNVRAAALVNGTVGGSLVDAPRAARLQVRGFKTLGNAWAAVPDYQDQGLAVRADWAGENSDRLVRFLRAIVAADRWIYAPENRDESIGILAATLRMTAAESGRLYEQYVEQAPAIPRNGEIAEAGVRVVVEMLAELQALPPPLPDPARLVDTSYLQRAR